MRYLFIVLFSWLNITHAGPDLYLCKSARIAIFSGALIEDIKAATSSGLSVYNAASGELDVSVTISSLQFEKSFMQQHFNSD